MISSVKERFCQASYDIFANLESFLLQNVNHPEQNNEELERSISEIYGDDIDLTALKVESNVLRTILKTKPVSLRDVYKEIVLCKRRARPYTKHRTYDQAAPGKPSYIMYPRAIIFNRTKA